MKTRLGVENKERGNYLFPLTTPVQRHQRQRQRRNKQHRLQSKPGEANTGEVSSDKKKMGKDKKNVSEKGQEDGARAHTHTRRMIAERAERELSRSPVFLVPLSSHSPFSTASPFPKSSSLQRLGGSAGKRSQVRLFLERGNFGQGSK